MNFKPLNRKSRQNLLSKILNCRGVACDARLYLIFNDNRCMNFGQIFLTEIRATSEACCHSLSSANSAPLREITLSLWLIQGFKGLPATRLHRFTK